MLIKNKVFSATGTVISFIPHPIAIGVGLGMKGIAYVMSKIWG
ncbi:hypothetical protein [Candidatus Francisella endociliophora]|nr:hypothetical protein [Francisella sp. FSC1006]